MRIYLAGPMRGYPEFNFPLFHKVAKVLRDCGNEVFNPAERDEKAHGEDLVKGTAGDLSEIPEFSLREALAEDLSWICRHADAVALLPGWEQSRGATAERATGKALGLTIVEIGEDWI